MSKIAVIAHAGKTFGGGLLELRRELERQGIEDPFWREVPKSKAAPREVRRALDDGAELIFVWGGDGTVQRCLDAVAGSDAALAILPAGTANLLRHESRASRRTSSGALRSACTATGASSMWDASTASVSASWPARASTPR